MSRITSYGAATTLVVALLAAPAPVVASRAFSCGGRPATIVGTPGDDTVVGTSAADVMVGLAGEDDIVGLEGDDVLCGGPESDILRGGQGDDVLLGGLGAGLLFGGAGDDRMVGVLKVGNSPKAAFGGSGQDRYEMRFVMHGAATLSDVVGRVDLRQQRAWTDTHGIRTLMQVRSVEEVEVGRGRWTLIGSYRAEVLVGGRTPGAMVTIHAGGGDDVLEGTLRDDLLDGGRGFDTVLASAGHDTCVSVELVRDGRC